MKGGIIQKHHNGSTVTFTDIFKERDRKITDEIVSCGHPVIDASVIRDVYY
jgi:hypothetical protein